jgi:IclR helix-turn-helix domain
MGSTLRCLKVLELLAEEPFELTLSDIAASLDAPRPTAHRFMTTLIPLANSCGRPQTTDSTYLQLGGRHLKSMI